MISGSRRLNHGRERRDDRDIAGVGNVIFNCVDIFVGLKCIRCTSVMIVPRFVYVALKCQLSHVSEIE
jgi:hypothetical protein